MGNSQGSNEEKKRASSLGPSTSITSKERSEVTRTWAILQKNLVSNGEELFINFFTAYPEYKQLFPSLSDLAASDLAGNRELCDHAMAATNQLTIIVENLKDLEIIADELQILGRTHAQVTVTEQAFYDLLEVFLELLHTKLGGKFTSVAREAWIKTFNVVYTYVFRGVNEHRDLERCKKIAICMLSGTPSEHLMPVHKKSVLKTTSIKIVEPSSAAQGSHTGQKGQTNEQELNPATGGQENTKPKEQQNVKGNPRPNFAANTLSKGAANLLAKGVPNPQSNVAANPQSNAVSNPQSNAVSNLQSNAVANPPKKAQITPQPSLQQNVAPDRRSYDTTRTPKNSLVEKKNSIVEKKD